MRIWISKFGCDVLKSSLTLMQCLCTSLIKGLAVGCGINSNRPENERKPWYQAPLSAPKESLISAGATALAAGADFAVTNFNPKMANATHIGIDLLVKTFRTYGAVAGYMQKGIETKHMITKAADTVGVSEAATKNVLAKHPQVAPFLWMAALGAPAVIGASVGLDYLTRKDKAAKSAVQISEIFTITILGLHFLALYKTLHPRDQHIFARDLDQRMAASNTGRITEISRSTSADPGGSEKNSEKNVQVHMTEGVKTEG